ncbi:MAG: curli assembly protein CsgF [Pseudomonadota bacterium]|nr:curli assembly protein CsgF [Pseudomonadota bacterium]
MNLSSVTKALSTGVASAVLVGALASLPRGAGANELVYVPINPSFGGNPANGAVLLGSAQAQNKHKDPDQVQPSAGLTEKTALQQFNDILERSILGQLASAATSSVVGSNGKLVPGTVQTGNFIITIVDLGGGLLRVTTTDKATGAVSTFEVGQ